MLLRHSEGTIPFFQHQYIYYCHDIELFSPLLTACSGQYDSNAVNPETPFSRHHASFDRHLFTAACLEGFTQELPPKDQYSQFSTNSINPNSEVVFTGVKFLCNGTLEAVHVPIELRGSDYQFWDHILLFRLRIWRQNNANFVRMESIQVAENITTRNLEMVDAITIRLNESDVVQFIENIDVQIVIIEGDVMGALMPKTTLRSINISGTVQSVTVAEHLPLLLHRDTQLPLMTVNFILSTDDPTTSEGLLQYNEMTM